MNDDVFAADTVQINREIVLDDIGVMGSRAPLTQSQASRMVTVLSREDIQAAPVQSVNDLLKYAVGVDVRQRGTLGSQTDISIRGGTQEQITILLNGINICDPQTGHNTLDLPCQLSDIVRIEVLEGPAGRAYGTSSLVGAINIVTSAGKDVPRGSESFEARLEGGSYGYADLGIRMALGNTISNSLSASYTRSDGFSRSRAGHLNTDYNGGRAFYQGRYDNTAMSIRWHLGYTDKGWGSGTFYASPRWQADEQYEHTTKIFSAVQAENKQGPVHFRPAIYWNQNRDRYEGYRNLPDVMKYNYNRCNIYGVTLNSYFDWRWGRTALGAEIRNEDLVSGNLGEPLFNPQPIHGTDRDYTLGINRTNMSAHLEHNILLERLTLSAGFVAIKSSWSAADWRLYPGIDVSYLLYGSNLTSPSSFYTPHSSLHTPRTLKLFASYNSSLRLPSFTEMYYKLQGYAADPHLKPEEMQALEAGVQYTSPTLQAKTSLWYHHGKNMIDWTMDTTLGETAVWESVNHTKINAIGLEASLGIDLKRLLALPLPSSTLDLSYSYITQDKDLEAGIVSQYALEYLRHKLVAVLRTTVWRQLAWTIHLRWQDRMGQYTTFAGDVCDYRPFALLDTRLQWNGPWYTLYTEVNNVLNNRSYVDFGNVPQPGAWFVAGIIINIKR